MFINRIELRMVREKARLYGDERIKLGCKVTRAEDVFCLFGWLSEQVQEEVYALYLDAKNKVIGYTLVSKGAVDQAVIAPADILRPALLSSAVSIVLVHNHPSGDPGPSLQDRQLTKQLEQACSFVGIKLLDHLVIGDGSYRSLKETGD
jgi:DNA repair protein RadC